MVFNNSPDNENYYYLFFKSNEDRKIFNLHKSIIIETELTIYYVNRINIILRTQRP